MQLAVPLVLASRSPRRKRLLEQLGLSFTVDASPEPEPTLEGLTPTELVQALAVHKAAPITDVYADALVLAADTVVELDGEVLHKPSDAAEARATLRRLSGQTHTVHTGFALEHNESSRQAIGAESARVTFGALTDDEIAAYVKTGAPLDKAGSYGIQDLGALFVERIEGDYYTIVGLPLRRLYRCLQERFADLMTL